MKEIFKRLIIDFQERRLETFFPREYDIPTATGKIVSPIGVRRFGKTYMFFHMIQRLRRRVPNENIIYINI